jgi:hypothetical protein
MDVPKVPSSSGWLSIAGTSHRYAHPGRYCSYVEAGLPGGEMVKSEQICLEVKGKRVPKLVLKAEPAQAKPGQEVLFRARLEPSMPGVQYKFVFGDKQTRDWGKEETASHKYAQEGTYRVKALARGEDIGDIEGRELLLKVEKSHLIVMKREKYPPEESILVPLSTHEVKSVHHPSLEIFIDDHPLGKMVFDLTVTLKLKGIILKIQDARIKKIRTGECRGTGVFKFGEIVLLKKESEDIPLPGSISLGDGIAL